MKKNLFFVGILKATDEGSGSLSQCYGSVDPDPFQNVTEPQRWFVESQMQGTHLSNLLFAIGKAFQFPGCLLPVHCYSAIKANFIILRPVLPLESTIFFNTGSSIADPDLLKHSWEKMNKLHVLKSWMFKLFKGGLESDLELRTP